MKLGKGGSDEAHLVRFAARRRGDGQRAVGVEVRATAWRGLGGGLPLTPQGRRR